MNFQEQFKANVDKLRAQDHHLETYDNGTNCCNCRHHLVLWETDAGEPTEYGCDLDPKVILSVHDAETSTCSNFLALGDRI